MELFTWVHTRLRSLFSQLKIVYKIYWTRRTPKISRLSRLKLIATKSISWNAMIKCHFADTWFRGWCLWVCLRKIHGCLDTLWPKPIKGKKTLMYCHAFRCGRVTLAASVTEAIRLASQTTYAVRKDSIGSSRSRRGSQASRASTVSLSSISSENEVGLRNCA